MKKHNLNFSIANAEFLPVSKKTVDSWLSQVGSELGKIKVRNQTKLKYELSVVFLKKTAARKLNYQYRKKNYATDVLSFSGGEKILGELVICPEVVKKQARENQISFANYLGYILLHGVLHLLGYDHELSKKEETLMFNIQDKIFARVLKNFQMSKSS